MNVKSLSAALMGLLIITGPPARADELVLDIEAAVAIALENNLGLRSERIDLGSKRRAKSTAWNAFLPSLSAGASLSHTAPGQEGSSLQPAASPWSFTTSLKASLALSSAIGYRIRDAVLQYETGAIGLQAAKRELERDVRKSFYNLLLMGEETRLIEENIETARKRFDRVNKMYEKGLVPELDLLSARVNLETLKPDLEEARVSRQTTLLEFKQMLGLVRQTEIVLDGSIEVSSLDLDAESLIREYTSGRLDIQALIKGIQILKNQKKLIRAEEFVPTLSVSYSYSTGLKDPFGAEWAEIENWSDQGTLGLSLTIPLDGWLPSSPGRVAVSEIEDSIEKANLELAQELQTAEIEIEALVLRLEKSLRTLEALEKNVALAQKAYDLTEQEYNAGVTEILEVEEAYDELLEAKLALLTERYNYQAGLLDLEYALAAKLVE